MDVVANPPGYMVIAARRDKHWHPESKATGCAPIAQVALAMPTG
jgi:hypothetical protein